jgi:hypothetical protein
MFQQSTLISYNIKFMRIHSAILQLHVKWRSWDSAVSIATGYGLEDGGVGV